MNEDRGTAFVILNIFIFKLDDTPNAAAEQSIIMGRLFFRNRDILNAQVRELGLVAVSLYVQVDSDLVYDSIASALTQYGQ